MRMPLVELVICVSCIFGGIAAIRSGELVWIQCELASSYVSTRASLLDGHKLYDTTHDAVLAGSLEVVTAYEITRNRNRLRGTRTDSPRKMSYTDHSR